MPRRTSKRVVLTTHELGLSGLGKRVERTLQRSQVLRDEIHHTIEIARTLRKANSCLTKQIKQAAKGRPTLKEIKNSPLHVLPCRDNCVETKCEHYLDCVSVTNMFEWVLKTDPDPETLVQLYKSRNDAIDSWQKKGIFRSCMFKVPHGSALLAQQHADLLREGDPKSTYYAYKCEYGEHYHVAHSKASMASLRARRETILG